MGSKNRSPYLTATVLDQKLLDDCASNLDNQLELAVDISAPMVATYTNPSGNIVHVEFPAHGLQVGQSVQILAAASSSCVGTKTITAAGVNSFQFDAGASVSPGSGSLTFIGYLRLSDRNKYVGPTFYEARLVFPVISRTIGEMLSPTLEFSTLSLEINNADSKYNHLLPAGADYSGWVGQTVTVRLGLRDVASTYRTIFSGRVTSEGGFQRTLKSFILVARNDFEKLNVNFPKTVLTKSAFPDLEESMVNYAVPIIYGDWTTEVEPGMASVPAFVVNGADADVTGEDSPHSTNLQLIIADHDLAAFDTTQVFIKRGTVVQVFDAADVVNVGSGNRTFELRQVGTTPAATTLVDGEVFAYERGDEIFVKVKGKSLGAYSDNIVAISRDILETYAGALTTEFDTSWGTLRDKASPAQSAIRDFKARVWLQEPVSALEYVLSLLEQVRLELFIDVNNKLKLSSLHFEDFVDAPTFQMKNWDIEEGSFKPQIDTRVNINRAQGVFNLLPNRNENYQQTPILRNQAAINLSGQEVAKKIVYPNLYQPAVVQYQVQETLRLVSSYFEIVELTSTWRSLLLDIGDFVALDVQIESVQFQSVPAQIRSLGYDPNGLKIPMRVLSTQLIPFPGWEPTWSPDGIVGGYNATITVES